jgi:hypothetical protein
MSYGWFAYVVLMICLIGQCVINHREHQRIRARRLETDQYAHCQCGQRMSEWFVKDGLMWHPEFARGCGWVSSWVDHEDYQGTRQQHKEK